jgi:hypothetical protein
VVIKGKEGMKEAKKERKNTGKEGGKEGKENLVCFSEDSVFYITECNSTF